MTEEPDSDSEESPVGARFTAAERPESEIVLSRLDDEETEAEHKRTSRLPRTLELMQETLTKGQLLVEMGRGRFEDDWVIRDAAVTVISQLGEEVKRLPESFKSDRPAIEWQQIATMRNRLIHEYAPIDTEVVWKTLVEDFPSVQRSLESPTGDVSR